MGGGYQEKGGGKVSTRGTTSTVRDKGKDILLKIQVWGGGKETPPCLGDLKVGGGRREGYLNR